MGLQGTRALSLLFPVRSFVRSPEWGFSPRFSPPEIDLVDVYAGNKATHDFLSLYAAAATATDYSPLPRHPDSKPSAPAPPPAQGELAHAIFFFSRMVRWISRLEILCQIRHSFFFFSCSRVKPHRINQNGLRNCYRHNPTICSGLKTKY